MSSSLIPRDPSQKTEQPESVITKKYLAELYPITFTCQEDSEGNWEQLAFTVKDEIDNKYNRSRNFITLDVTHDPLNEVVYGSHATTQITSPGGPAPTVPTTLHTMSTFKDHRLEVVGQIRDWRSYALDPAVLPSGHNKAYEGEVVVTQWPLTEIIGDTNDGSTHYLVHNMYVTSDRPPGKMSKGI